MDNKTLVRRVRSERFPLERYCNECECFMDGMTHSHFTALERILFLAENAVEQEDRSTAVAEERIRRVPKY